MELIFAQDFFSRLTARPGFDKFLGPPLLTCNCPPWSAGSAGGWVCSGFRVGARAFLVPVLIRHFEFSGIAACLSGSIVASLLVRLLVPVG